MEIYKPNSKVTGFGFRAEVNSFKKDDKPRQHFAQFNVIAQSGEKSFSGNRDNPVKNFSVKMSLIELATLINFIEAQKITDKDQTFYHQSPNRTTTIAYNHFEFKGDKSLKLAFNTKNGEDSGSVKCWFTSSEAVLFREWLKWAIAKIFDEQERERIKSAVNGKKKSAPLSKKKNSNEYIPDDNEDESGNRETVVEDDSEDILF